MQPLSVSGDPSCFLFTAPFLRFTFHVCIRGIPDTNCRERLRGEQSPIADDEALHLFHYPRRASAGIRLKQPKDGCPMTTVGNDCERRKSSDGECDHIERKVLLMTA